MTMLNFAKEILDIKLGALIPIVDFRATIPGEKLEKKRKENTDLMWFGRLPKSIGTGKKTFTICQIRVT